MDDNLEGLLCTLITHIMAGLQRYGLHPTQKNGIFKCYMLPGANHISMIL